ncbi:hypothetical protein HanLR1_Chr01g0005881 [Helianthus annuus]|nr:hypothetical protein HanLR1_Chr01g0005881 [Helianthus annuus]
MTAFIFLSDTSFFFSFPRVFTTHSQNQFFLNLQHAPINYSHRPYTTTSASPPSRVWLY